MMETLMTQNAQATHSTVNSRPGFWALLREDVRCVFERDPAARTKLEVLTTYPGVHALIILPEIKLVIVERYDTDVSWTDPGDAGLELGLMIINAKLP